MPFNKSALKKLTRLLNALQTIDSQFPLQYAICFFEVAENEGCSLGDLKKATGMPLPTVSRVIGALSDKRQKNAVAYGLLKVRYSEKDSRRKEIYLTPKGKKFKMLVTRIMADGPEKEPLD